MAVRRREVVGAVAVLAAVGVVVAALWPVAWGFLEGFVAEWYYGVVVEAWVYGDGSVEASVTVGRLGLPVSGAVLEADLKEDLLAGEAGAALCLRESPYSVAGGIELGRRGVLLLGGGVFEAGGVLRGVVESVRAEPTPGGVRVEAVFRVVGSGGASAYEEYAYTRLEELARRAAGLLRLEGFTVERLHPDEGGGVRGRMAFTIPPEVYSGEALPVEKLEARVEMDPRGCWTRIAGSVEGDATLVLGALARLPDPGALPGEAAALARLLQLYLGALEPVQPSSLQLSLEDGVGVARLPRAKPTGGGDPLGVLAGVLLEAGLPGYTKVRIVEVGGGGETVGVREALLKDLAPEGGG
ncbi:hypothetical protein APE_1173.1 [Aeropyrum pernix K1]|uniref:Uncharacterized protein n=1 Tax=Aeropyrum pernix (strain ATCC 700893 / DSM 11879 / JCM 9820 / NBRC 100138 / K1) TaxID=272557 RepID=Q9YCT9_AERPE|nr:hypothetical protein [Aeropyrum pernix]BAA80158.2 hypothetical protein APE_1173.1 [Aeropyrum pernix K1]